MSERRQYLGDGVYVECLSWGGIVLTTNDGYRDTNQIVLEPEMLTRLVTLVGEPAT